MKILVIGCVKSSEIFLKKLIEMNTNIVGVITKAESNFNADFVDLGVICRKENIDYLYVCNLNDYMAKDYLYEKGADLILCLGWSQILDQEILHMPKLGCVGFHPAKLPYNRGRHPLIWALALGLEQTASTFFLMDETADTGKIISQKCVEIDYLDDAASLYDKIMETAVIQLEGVVQGFKSGMLQGSAQLPEEGNVWRKRGIEDGKIDWRMSSRNIYNLVRALTRPYVGAHIMYREKVYKIWKVKEMFEKGFENSEPGKIIEVFSDHEFIVKAGDNLIEVLECDSIHLRKGEYL